ncbi:hypothetical protein H7J86_24355 [Mycobacterium hackensackense]|uniref:hypothetical protein n=1 Tax=Mycobacterium hackensackense TaxID=228909 RepID=UPI002265BDD7|nr:hypothetical protein [Mycobacterium hackensackense]MCV7255300.1 hypothetical protein [Mycobacterium hackensackense]
MPDITNTSAQPATDHFAGSVVLGTDAYITGMEAEGQRQLVNSDKLPAEADWPEFEALGFVKGDPVPGDDLFVTATLPAGWKREGSDHAMWSHIVDERGIRRVGIFYKAAFYDRRADMSVTRVGSEVAAGVIYGDADVALPQCWPLLTDVERAEVQRSIAYYAAEAQRHPDIYAKQGERAQALADLIAAEGTK